MAQKLMQVNFRLVITPDQFEQACTPEAAQPLADVPGLDWKIWIINRDTGEAGGLKLFADEASLEAYMNGPIWTGALQSPAWKDVEAKVFDILAIPSQVTRAPLGQKGPLTFNRMAQEAFQAVATIKPADVYRRLKKEPDLLVIDVRDSSQVAVTGTIPGAANITLGDLTYMADCEVPEDWRDPRLADRSRPIITTCIMGPLGAVGGKLLHDMGFTNVQILEGGVQAWIDAGLEMKK